MRRTRSKSLRGLVITKLDLQKVHSIFEREAKLDAKVAADDTSLPEYLRANPFRPTIKVDSENSIRTQVDDNSVFENDVLDLEKTLAIDFTYGNGYTKKSLNVGLRETDEPEIYESSFSVGGGDPAWVEATFVDLERIFSAMHPQFALNKTIRLLAIIIIAFAIGHTWIFLLDSLFGSLITPTSSPPTWAIYVREHPPLGHLILAVFKCGGGFFPALFLMRWVEKLWPSIEFDFGPEHLKKRKSLRARLAVVTSVLVLPIALEILTRQVFD
jgi:hypothetical protein